MRTALGSRRPTADVLVVPKPLWDRAPETASRLRGRIQTVLDAAQALGHIAEDKANPARWKGHLDHLLAPPKKLGVRGHHKAMPYDQLPEFVNCLRASDNVAALALEFLIVTANSNQRNDQRGMARVRSQSRRVVDPTRQDENQRRVFRAAQRARSRDPR